MASAGHTVAQQRDRISRHINTLINQTLKEICKAYGQQVSGTKAVLQQRVIEVLDKLVRLGDEREIARLRYRVENHGLTPPAHLIADSSAPQNMAPGGARPAAQAAPRMEFKPSPFYEFCETVIRQHDLPEMPQNRHTVKVSITLSDEQCRKLKEDPSAMKLLIYCGQTSDMSAWSRLDIAFPNQLEVKINNDDVKGNFKGLKNKPGSTKPADITSYVRKVAGYPNQLSVCYALTAKRYAFTVQMVKSRTPDELTQRIKKANVISKQKVLDEMRQANLDPDIAATSSKMSLKDPVSTLRITVPIRSTVCRHNQCFDGAYFMMLQEQAPTWSCPICSKMLSFESLCVDKYFEEILSTTNPSIEQVTIEPDGTWRVEEEDEDKGKSNQARGEARASYDDDFDDEIIDLEDTPQAAKTFKTAWQPRPGASPFAQPNLAINTPPLSSREPSIAQSVASGQRSGGHKRQSDFIDLTLSDEDEPPRSAKRAHTGNASGTAMRSYATPTPLSDLPRNLAYKQQPADAASSLRTQQQQQQQQQPQPPRTPTTFGTMSMSPAQQRQSPLDLFSMPFNAPPPKPRDTSGSPAQTNGYQPFGARTLPTADQGMTSMVNQQQGGSGLRLPWNRSPSNDTQQGYQSYRPNYGNSSG